MHCHHSATYIEIHLNLSLALISESRAEKLANSEIAPVKFKAVLFQITNYLSFPNQIFVCHLYHPPSFYLFMHKILAGPDLLQIFHKAKVIVQTIPLNFEFAKFRIDEAAVSGSLYSINPNPLDLSVYLSCTILYIILHLS